MPMYVNGGGGGGGGAGDAVASVILNDCDEREKFHRKFQDV